MLRLVLVRGVRGPVRICRELCASQLKGGRSIFLAQSQSMSSSTSSTKLSATRRLILLARPECKRILLAVGFLVVSSSVTLSVPYFIGRIIDTIYTIEDKEVLVDKLHSIAYFLVGIFLLGACANGCRIYFIQTAGQRIIRRLREDVYASIMRSDVAFFDKSKSGELVNRLANDTAVVGSSLTYNISDGLRSSLQVIGGVSLMVYTSPYLSMTVLGILPPVALLAAVSGRYLKKISKQVQDTLARTTELAEERISNIRVVRAFTKEQREIDSFSERVGDVLDVAYKEVLGRSFFFTMSGLTGNMMILMVFYAGGMMVHDSSLSVGQLSSFILYSTYVGISIGGLSNFYTELMKALGASTRLWELVDNRPEIPLSSSNLLQPTSLRGDVSFDHVTFSYPSRTSVPVLKDFSLRIPSGKVTALVGSSGCGKTTVASLLMRYYDTQSGQITVDDENLTRYSPKHLRHHIAYVTQDPVLFGGTIRENIEYGCDDLIVSEEKLTQAAADAHCLEFIDSFPSRFETIVGERGVMLSGGQRQRLSIARAIIRDPRILILDEATSALDTESEGLVQLALQELMPGRTTIMIAHRLSTIRNAHNIAVIDQGSVLQQGSYEELIADPDGPFAKLVSHQVFAES